MQVSITDGSVIHHADPLSALLLARSPAAVWSAPAVIHQPICWDEIQIINMLIPPRVCVCVLEQVQHVQLQ